MRKLVTLLIAFLLLLSSFVGCTNNSGKTPDDTTTSGEYAETSPETTPSVTDPVSEYTYSTWLSDGHVKVTGEGKAPKDAQTSITVNMAKNEKEAFNISLRADNNVEGIKLVMLDGETDDMKIEIFNEYLIKTGRKYHYPDPLVPYTDSFDVEKNVTKTLMVRFDADENTKAGERKYKFALVHNDKALAEYDITVNVWNFALPEALSCESAVGLSNDQIFMHEKTSGPLSGKIVRAYYDMLVDYGMSPYDLPYDVLNDKADEYMSDPRVTSFRVSHSYNDSTLIKQYEKLKSNPEWLDKAYYYPFDEPGDLTDLQTIEKSCERLKSLTPEIRIVIPFFQNITYDNNTDEVDFLDRYLGIWCPKAPCWNKNGWLADPLGRGYFGDRMAEQKEQGDKIWWYVCWEPGSPYCNLYVNEIGLEHIELFWQQYFYEVDGFLYWASNYWNYVKPYESMATVPHLSSTCYGDGSLLYPGKPVGVDGPVASFRLDCIRNGMEDYDLLLMAEELLGRSWVVDQVKKVSESLTVHTKDAAVYFDVRNTIGDAIEAELNK